MAAASSTKTATATKDRRKSSNTATKATAVRVASSSPDKSEKPNGKVSSRMVTLKVGAQKLRAIVDPESLKKEDTPIKEDIKESPPAAATVPAATNGAAEIPSDSNPATPAASGTPVPQPMGPPLEGPKKKGVKRAANGTGEPKARGRPGPKKKQRLEDGTIVETAKPNGTAAHKLGPKANQGAINAGLRALDRSGKPCRKWNRGGFQLKSFTGVVWEIPRWTAPPKPKPESPAETSAAVPVEGTSSNKENKETGPVKGENGDTGSNTANANNTASASTNANGVDVEMQSAVPSPVAAESPTPAPAPAPFAIAAA